MVCASFSVAVAAGLAGSFSDDAGDLFTLDKEISDDPNGTQGSQIWSAYCPNGMASGSTVSMFIKEGYHGQSPYWVVIALNSGDGRRMVLDVADGGFTPFTLAGDTHSSPSIVSASEAIIISHIGGSNSGTAGWWTPGGGWGEIYDTGPGTESNYCIAGQGRIATSSYSGNSSGSASTNLRLGLIISSYKPVSGVRVSSAGFRLGRRSFAVGTLAGMAQGGVYGYGKR